MIKDIVSEWDAEFVDSFSQADLVELIKASNYMDIACLLNLTCAKVGSVIRGKTSDEIREAPEDEAKIKEDHKGILLSGMGQVKKVFDSAFV